MIKSHNNNPRRLVSGLGVLPLITDQPFSVLLNGRLDNLKSDSLVRMVVKRCVMKRAESYTMQMGMT